MIINSQIEKNAEVLVEGMQQSSKMTIDTDSQGVLQMILSEQLYTDPMGSVTREWTSNALDATRELGVDTPINVSLGYANGNYHFSVQDFGIGMSPERVEKVVKKYAASTKRGDENQLGFFGLGLKSGLAYADKFEINTIYNGIQYNYVMYKGEEETMFDLVHSFDTRDPNGTTVSITVKPEDRWSFIEKIKEQLAYFQGVNFQVNGISNGFKIIESEHWKKSELCNDSNVHIALDNVYYPLDFSKLKIKPINLGVALNFKVSDGLMPTPSRESIKLTPTVKELILSKLRLVCEYFVDKYEEQLLEGTSIFTVYPKISGHKTVEVAGNKFYVKEAADFLGRKLQEPTVVGSPDIDIKKLWDERFQIIAPYGVVGEIYSGKYTGYKEEDINADRIWRKIEGGAKLICIREKPKKVLMDYIKSKGSCYFVRYHGYKELKLGKPKANYWDQSGTGYYRMLGLKDVPREQWRNRIQQYLLIQKDVRSRIIDVDTIVPDEKWLEERKANRVQSVAYHTTKEEIRVKYGRQAARGNFWAEFTTYQDVVEINNLRKNKYLTIYGKEEHKIKLSEILQIAVATLDKNLKVALLSERDFNKVNKFKIHNFMSIEEFSKGGFKTFGKYCSLLKLAKVVKETEMSVKSSVIEHFHSSFAADMKLIEKLTNGIKRMGHLEDVGLVAEMMELCEKNNYWDQEIEALTNRFKETLPKFDFLSFMQFSSTYDYRNSSYVSTVSDKQRAFIIEVLKARKVRMNPDCYITAPVVEVEEPKAEETEELEGLQPLTDEEAQELDTIIADEIVEAF